MNLKRLNLTVLLVTILVLIPTVQITYGFSGSFSSIPIYITPPVGDYSYLIDTNGTYTIAKNGTTGEIEFGSTNTGNVFNWASGNATDGGLIAIQALEGNYYNFGSTQWVIPENKSIKIVGLGPRSSYGSTSEKTSVIIRYTGSSYAFNSTGVADHEHASIELENLNFALWSSNCKGAIYLKDFAYFKLVSISAFYAVSTEHVDGMIGIYAEASSPEESVLRECRLSTFGIGFLLNTPTVTIDACFASGKCGTAFKTNTTGGIWQTYTQCSVEWFEDYAFCFENCKAFTLINPCVAKGTGEPDEYAFYFTGGSDSNIVMINPYLSGVTNSSKKLYLGSCDFWGYGNGLETYGTATITSGQTSVIVAHGLWGDITPVVTVTPKSDLDSTGYWYSANSTHITINLDSTLGGNVDFGYSAQIIKF